MVWRTGAVYHGRRAVQGTQSQSTLTAIVDNIVREDGDPNQLHPFTKGVGKGERCQVVVEEERFLVVGGGIRGPGGRDEGFESDSESSTGSNSCDDHCCAIEDIKVISDHVLRLDALLQQEGHDSGSTGFASASSSSSSSDDASSATSSGAESEDDTPRNHKQASNNGACCAGSNKVPGDVFLLSDVLFCHVDATTPRFVVLVVKDAGSSLIHAHVYETSSNEQARTLFQHYKEASNKYKLNRYRNSKRKLDIPKNLTESSGISSVSKSGISGKHSSRSLGVVTGKNIINASNINSVSDSDRKVSTSSTDSGISNGFDGPGRTSVRSVEARLKAQGRNNINVIEIRETTSPLEDGDIRSDGGSRANWNLLQHIDSNGVTHIEIDSGPCSITSTSSSKSGEATTSSEYSSLVSLSAPESSPEQVSGAQSLPTRPERPSSRADNLNAGGSLRGRSSQPNILPQPPIKEVLAAGEKDKKFRQRQPARLLRTDENGLKSTAGIVIGGKLIGGAQDTRKLENKRQEERKEELQERNKREERQGDDRESRSRRDRHEDRSIVRDTHRSSTVDPYISRPERQSRARDQSRGRARHSKGPAPPPPPRRHPSNPSLMLVPTKSGAENVRAFYPKESHIVRGNKIVRVEFPGYQSWGIHHDGSSSPHVHQRYAYYHPGSSAQAWVGPHEYHAASRPRDSTITPEMRRRSRSKSPARKPMANRYIDAMSNFNISQKLKDIKDAVVTKAQNGPNIVNNLSTGENRGHQRTASTISAPPDANNTDTESGLKPLLKKGRRPVTDTNRRVTFSAYATVQVMDA